MNTSSKATLMATAVGVATALAMACAPVTAMAAGGIKAAFVEEVIPSHTFFETTFSVNSIQSFGPGTGVLGVSSITLTNFDSSSQQVALYAPIFSSGSGCAGTVIGGTGSSLVFIVQPLSTLHLTYPTALVFNPVQGRTCIATQVLSTLHGNFVQIAVNGVLN